MPPRCLRPAPSPATTLGMANNITNGNDPWVQLATRIPKTLHRSMKLHVVVSEQSMMDFVTEAIQEKLAKDAKRRRSA